MRALSFAVAAALLLGSSACRTPLHTAALHGDNATLNSELDRGADINGFNDGLTPLMFAAENGQISTVKRLLERGADPNLKSRLYKRTALDYVSYSLQGVSDETKRTIAGILREATGISQPRQAPGNLDNAAPAPAPSLHAQSDVDSPVRRGAERPDDFALIIGIEDYQNLPKADYGVRDAETVRRHYEALGVPARNIIALEGAQATGSKLRSYLQQWLPRNVKPGSTVFVYYSGHGAPDPSSGEAYLVPWDADPMFLTTSAYPLKQFYAELAKLKAKRVLVALDACFSGSGGRSVLAKGARPLVAKVDESVPSAENLTVLAAASGSEITGTLDDQAHGIFTYHYLKGLSAGAKTPRALFDYLMPKVQDDARRQNREQSPTLSGANSDAAF